MMKATKIAKMEHFICRKGGIKANNIRFWQIEIVKTQILDAGVIPNGLFSAYKILKKQSFRCQDMLLGEN